ncbi:hypothetical protein [Paraburkholderia bannensis]|uniref:hypothetical protein n=1 Tax=Paraburkholderia bannensis TaxID=765414 RepID=UPI002AC3136E|nr:hypothetical protein [Paraburkholderia bannensis]
MSSRSRKARAKFMPATVDQQANDCTFVDAWVPDYGRKCENCGETPVVTGVADGRVVYNGSLCGVCSWGNSAAANPANW